MKRKLNEAKAANKEILALNHSLMENLNEFQISYQSYKDKHANLISKVEAVYDFLVVFEGQGLRNQSRFCGKLVEQLKRYLAGEIDTLNPGEIARSRSGSEIFTDLGNYDMSNLVKSKTKLEELKQELVSLGRLISEVKDKDSKEQSFDLSNKSTELPSKPNEDKKKKYFQKIWDIKS